MEPAVSVVTCGRWRTQCYVVRDPHSGDTVVIDPGDDASRIAETVGGATVHAVLTTHGHYDHIGAAAELCETLRLPLLVDERDELLLERAPLYALSFERSRVSLPRRVTTLRAPGRVPAGSLDVELIHVPGHTPGSIAIRIGASLFSGDTLLHEAVGRTDLPGGDAEHLRRSVELLLTSHGDDVLLRPGHGRGWTVGEARNWWSAAATS